MPQEILNPTGETHRTVREKINRNFTDLFSGSNTDQSGSIQTINRYLQSLQDFTPSQLSDVIKNKADHLYLMDESSGGFMDRIGSLDLTVLNPPAASAANAKFASSRLFEETNQEFGTSPNAIDRNGGPFWFAIGVNFETIAGSDGLAGEFVTGTATYNWWVYRSSSNINFRVRRKGTTSNSDTVIVSGISAATDYIIVGRADGTNLWLDVTGFATAYDDNSLELGTENYPLQVGYTEISGTAVSNYLDGEIGFFVYGLGTLSEKEVELIKDATIDDFQALPARAENAKRLRKTLAGWGDSLTTSLFATTSWVERAVIDAGWSGYELHGVGGQNSDGIRDRFLEYSLGSHQRGCIAIWSGNNNASARQQVIDDVQEMVSLGLLAGAEKILILGLPNRSFINADQSVIDSHQSDLDFINTGFADIAASDDKVVYLDVHAWFTTAGNYTSYTLTSDDLTDISKGLAPRGVRDNPASTSATHFSDIGAQHLADLVSLELPN